MKYKKLFCEEPSKLISLSIFYSSATLLLGLRTETTALTNSRHSNEPITYGKVPSSYFLILLIPIN